jgi:hypothetical protein
LPEVSGAARRIWFSIHDGAETTAKSPRGSAAFQASAPNEILAEMPAWMAFSVTSNACLTSGFLS